MTTSTWKVCMTVCTWKVYIAQVRIHTRRIHVRAVPVFVKICATPILLCVEPVSTFAKNVMTLHQKNS